MSELPKNTWHCLRCGHELSAVRTGPAKWDFFIGNQCPHRKECAADMYRTMNPINERAT